MGSDISHPKVVVTFGTFDLFHVGHLRLLARAKDLGGFDTRLVVGVSSDSLNVRKKNKSPVYGQDDRLKIISALRCVDHVFLEESLELKANYLEMEKADVLVMGDDWRGKFDHFSSICKVVYLSRTPGISTTETLDRIRK